MLTQTFFRELSTLLHFSRHLKMLAVQEFWKKSDNFYIFIHYLPEGLQPQEGSYLEEPTRHSRAVPVYCMRSRRLTGSQVLATFNTLVHTYGSRGHSHHQTPVVKLAIYCSKSQRLIVHQCYGLIHTARSVSQFRTVIHYNVIWDVGGF
jgi:hypothetical protein